MNDTNENQTSQSLGERLRAARESKNLSLQDLAAMLHLQPNIIQHLENNQFDQLAAPTYVKGYIRSVARHVGLNADELVHQYDDGSNATMSSPEIVPQVKKPAQFSSTDKPVKIMTYLISFGLVLLLLIWWQSEFIVRDENTAASESGHTSAGGPHAGGFHYTFEVIEHPPGPFLSQDTDTAAIEPELVEDIPEPAEPLLDIESADLPGPGNVATESASALSDAILVIQVNADSWIEVRDAEREKLYLNLAKPGEQISITGTTPISVVLGNSQGVNVNWRGKPFDIEPHETAGVARFKLE